MRPINLLPPEVATLLRNLRSHDDADSLALLLLLGTEQGRGEQARLWARRLRDATAFGARRHETAVMLHSLGLHDAAREQRPTTHQVATLAMELTSSEEVIPALVEAQRRKLDPATADLLRGAIERARPDLVHEGPACEALARLIPTCFLTAASPRGPQMARVRLHFAARGRPADPGVGAGAR